MRRSSRWQFFVDPGADNVSFELLKLALGKTFLRLYNYYMGLGLVGIAVVIVVACW